MRYQRHSLQTLRGVLRTVKRSSSDVRKVREAHWALDIAQNVIGRSVDRNRCCGISCRERVYVMTMMWIALT